jgi:hypothetical protein
VVLGAVKRGGWLAFAFLRWPLQHSKRHFVEELMGSPLGLFYEFDVRAFIDYGQFMDAVPKPSEKAKSLSRKQKEALSL